MELWIALGITLIIVAFFIVELLKEGYKQLFSKISTLIQTLGIVGTIWYAIDTNKTNTINFNIQMENQRVQIEKQQEQINRTDSSTKLTLDELKSISGSSSQLIPKIEIINKLVSDIPNKVDEISSSFDLLNQYTKEQAEIIKEKNERKSDLYIKDIVAEKLNDSMVRISTINIINKGNLEGRLVKLFMFLDSNEVSKFSSINFESCRTDENKFQITMDYSDRKFIISAFDTQPLWGDNLEVSLKYTGLNSFWIKYDIIFYDEMGRFNEQNYEINFK